MSTTTPIAGITDPRRFRQFVILDLGAAVGGVVTLAVVVVLLEAAWLAPLLLATLASVGLLTLALRLHAQGAVDAAAIAVCATFWLLLVVGPATIPSIFGGFAVLMVWPVLFAVPHVRRSTFRLIVGITAFAATIALELALHPDPAGVAELPEAVLDTAYYVIGAVFVGLSLAQLYGYSGRLGEIVEALRVSERSLEAKVAARTAEYEHANAEAVALSRQLAAVLDNLADGLLVVDTGGTIVRLNPTLERMLDRPADDLLGRPVSKVLPELAGLTPGDSDSVVTGEVQLMDAHVGKAVASAFASGVIVLISDVTAEREVDRMKTDFISTVSHELRTPLTSILGFAKIIAKRLDERVLPAIVEPDPRTARAITQVRGNLDIIVTEGERLAALVNDVLDIAKMEAGRVDWRDEDVDVTELVRQSAAATKALFDAKGLPLGVDLADDLPTVRGDHHRLVQVVVNLLSNACKFTDEGGVTVSARRFAGELIVSVRDTGPGVAAEDHPKLFERFKQVGDTLTGKPQGTGLGLPICKEIIEHHGGRLWVDSAPGTGSTFSFSLPVADVPLAQRVDARVLLRDLRDNLRAAPTGPARILVVDDHEPLRQLLRQVLEGQGYQVFEAQDGREALRLAKQLRPDLITLDVKMPELNGFDVAAVLRHDPATMRIPIMIISIVEEAERGRGIGVDSYLTKPVDSAELLAQVHGLLTHGASPRRVVVVDDDAGVLETLRTTLEQQGWDVTAVPDPERVLEVARDDVPDIVIANASLSDRWGLVEGLRAERGMERVVFVLFE